MVTGKDEEAPQSELKILSPEFNESRHGAYVRDLLAHLEVSRVKKVAGFWPVQRWGSSGSPGRGELPAACSRPVPRAA